MSLKVQISSLQAPTVRWKRHLVLANHQYGYRLKSWQDTLYLFLGAEGCYGISWSRQLCASDEEWIRGKSGEPDRNSTHDMHTIYSNYTHWMICCPWRWYLLLLRNCKWPSQCFKVRFPSKAHSKLCRSLLRLIGWKSIYLVCFRSTTSGCLRRRETVKRWNWTMWDCLFCGLSILSTWLLEHFFSASWNTKMRTNRDAISQL